MKEMKLNDKQEKLFDFVKDHHGDQKRKYTNLPYHTHLWNVAEIVAEYLPHEIEVALCHDLFEDTKCQPDELKNFLTKNCRYHEASATSIVAGVKQLTDQFTHEAYPELNRKERKLREAHRMGYIGPDIQSVKYADLIDNTSTIILYDPGFAKTYLPEKLELLNRMRKGNIYLFMRCCHSLYEAMNSINHSTT